MDVQKNGDILVTETQKYMFDRDHTNKRYRYISLDKVAEIEDISVTENKRLIPNIHKITDNKLSIEWQHKLKAPSAYTFVLKYRIIGGLQVEGESTLVYWKAIFADRIAPVDRANVRVQLPPDLAGKVSSFTSFCTILMRRCPNCKGWKLDRSVEILVPVTKEANGRQQVIHHCSSCS
jgi:Predicted membrane protein (DUF2207)